MHVMAQKTPGTGWRFRGSGDFGSGDLGRGGFGRGGGLLLWRKRGRHRLG